MPSSKSSRLIRSYARDLLPEDTDLSQVGVLLDEQIPATIREVVERAKLSMLTEDRKHLTGGDLYASAVGMKRHMELLEPKVETVTPAEAFYAAFKGIINTSVNVEASATAPGKVDNVNKGVEVLLERLDVLNNAVSAGYAPAE